LDETVVQIAAEPDFILEGVIGQELLKIKVLLAAVAGLAFLVEFDPLGGGGAGESFQPAHFGPGGGAFGRFESGIGSSGCDRKDDHAHQGESAKKHDTLLSGAMVAAEGFDAGGAFLGGAAQEAFDRLFTLSLPEQQSPGAGGEGGEGEDKNDEAKKITHAAR
jgi:hypothetical protein